MIKNILIALLLLLPLTTITADIRSITTFSHKYIEYNKSTNTQNLSLDEALAFKVFPNLTILGKTYGMYNPTWQMIKAGLGVVYVWGGGFYSELSYTGNLTLTTDDPATTDVNEFLNFANSFYLDVSYENAFLFANASIKTDIAPGETGLFLSPGLKYILIPGFTIWNKYTFIYTLNTYKENPPPSHSYWGEFELWPLDFLGFRLGGTAAQTNTLKNDNSINSVIDVGILGGIQYKIDPAIMLKYQCSYGWKILPDNKTSAYYHLENLLTLDIRF